MVHLTLAGVSADGTRLLLVSEGGEEHTLAVDGPLRAALRGEPTRLGQLELDMESTLRPREIQNRIRAGATPEAVAQAAHTTVDKILPFANPVLAERAHMAQRAQRASVRRTGGEPGGARTLGDAVAAALRPLNVDPESVEWDAWRREDGRWALVAGHEHEGRAREGHFTYDAPGNYVTVDGPDAAWLIGDLIGDAPADPPRSTTGQRPSDDLQRARQRRLGTVPDEPADQLTIDAELGEDAIELVAEPAPAAAPAEVDAEVDAEVAPGIDAEIDPEMHPEMHPEADQAPDETSTADLTATAEAVRTGGAGESLDTGDTGEGAGASEAAGATAPRRPRRKGRASVPSWDEIMFGSGERD